MLNELIRGFHCRFFGGSPWFRPRIATQRCRPQHKNRPVLRLFPLPFICPAIPQKIPGSGAEPQEPRFSPTNSAEDPKIKDQPAYEFPTTRPNVRVLARKLPQQPKWLIAAWASDGVEGSATIAIPALGSVALHARATGSVYVAMLNNGNPLLRQVDIPTSEAKTTRPIPSSGRSSNDKRAEASIRAVIQGVDVERMSKRLFYLAKDPLPSRKLNSTLPGHKRNTLYEADDYLTAQLESCGYRVEHEGVRVQAFRRDASKPKHLQYSQPMPDDPWHMAYNLYAEKKGRRNPEEIILVLAHKDSQSWVDSPGANDNAVGTVGALEIACVLAKHRPERTIRFLFCNEEHTPWSSVTAAQNAKKRGDKIVAAFNLDGIGVKTAEQTAAGRKTNVTVYTEPAGARLAKIMSDVNDRFAIGLEQRIVKRTTPGDDDGSFVRAGYPAAVLNIGSWPYGDPNYHSEGDTPERCDVANAAKTVQATLAAILVLDQNP
jgi:hypothetical protein